MSIKSNKKLLKKKKNSLIKFLKMSKLNSNKINNFNKE